jgi:hypothetical protein
MVQWLRNLKEAESQYLEILRNVCPDLAVKVHRTQEKEWRPNPTKADVIASVGTNMVFILPPEFHAPDRKELPVAQPDFGLQPVIF